MARLASPARYDLMDPDDKRVLINMVIADAKNYATGGDISATEVARNVAAEIIARRQPNARPPLPDGLICVCFNNFGVDNRACDNVAAGKAPDSRARKGLVPDGAMW